MPLGGAGWRRRPLFRDDGGGAPGWRDTRNVVAIRPTEEQERAVEKFKTGKPLKISAFAGAGKTSTLTLMARTRNTRGIYLAFNKAIATEAKEKFPQTVDCRTTHSIAFRAISPQYRGSSGKLTESLHPKQLAATLDYEPQSFGSQLRLTEVQQAHLVLQTIKKFCQSAREAIEAKDVPRYGRLLGVSKDVLAGVQQWAAKEASDLWAHMVDARSDVPMGHDGYLKKWALQKPIFAEQYILLDEAQDTNEVVLDVLRRQQSQIVYVGDKHQQIYEWRGAVNAMAQVKGCEEAFLTQSFRFGDVIASTASQVIATLGETQRLRGNPAVLSAISYTSGATNAVLARTNASVIVEILAALRSGQRPCMVGGTDDLKRLLKDVYQLKDGNPGSTPEFFGFGSWDEVVEFAETEEGENLRTFVQLVEEHGHNKLWAAVKGVTANEQDANIILSTAHKAKGREWDSVRLTTDFASTRPEQNHADCEAEVRLFYVAMTRAKKLLSVDKALIDRFTSGAWKVASANAGPTAIAPRAAAPRLPPSPPVIHQDRPTPASRTTPKALQTPTSIKVRYQSPTPVLDIPSINAGKRKPAEPKSFWKKLFGD